MFGLFKSKKAEKIREQEQEIQLLEALLVEQDTENTNLIKEMIDKNNSMSQLVVALILYSGGEPITLTGTNYEFAGQYSLGINANPETNKIILSVSDLDNKRAAMEGIGEVS